MRIDSALFAQKNVELAKDPRYVIVLSFDTANTVLWAFTSHSDAALPPGLTGSILGIVEGFSGTSQTLNPDTANASIGSIDFSLVDRLSIVTTTLGAQLQVGRSTRKQRVQVYVGYQGLAWADYTLVQTQLVTEIGFSEGAYKFKCADIQREMRKDLFVLAKTTLALSVLAADTTINVVTTTGFNMVAHGTSYSDSPSATVGYIRIQDEIIRYTGTTATSFTGCVRGALNTRAVDHLIDSTAAQDRQTAVAEYVYLELPAIDLIYRLLTGKDRLGASVMPTTWNLGIATSYVRLADFTGIGKDLWDTTDDQQGFVVRFEDLEKTDGKKFIETELALLCGVFMPIYADGSVGCKRMANILAGAAYTGMLDETNVVSYGELTHDFNSLHNVIQISWNWEPLQKDFTRVNVLVDATSIAVHGRSDPYSLKFRGLHGSRHSSVILAQRFDFLRDRFAGPPQRLEVSALPSLNTAEVGDVKRVRLQNVRDFVAPGGGGPLDRSFEIQNISIDWITGALKTKLFASSASPGALAPTSDATVLTTGWYTGTGTALSSVVTITGSSPGHVTVGGSLAGNADMNAAGAIYYYDGDLQIDAGVEIAIANNVQLRVKGFLQNNGKINGKGKGFAGAAASDPRQVQYNPGTPGYIGTTEAGGGINLDLTTLVTFRGGIVAGANNTVPMLNLAWDGAALRGIPGDMRGTSGSSGMPSIVRLFFSFEIFLVAGGAGGASGAGLAIVCRGFAQGVAGSINISGADGLPGALLDAPGVTPLYAGAGAGGAPGALLMLLDGAGVTATGLTDAGFVALYGATPILAGSSDFVGTGDGTTFPLPSLSNARGGSRVQYVPGLSAPVPDIREDEEAIAQEFQVSNWTKRIATKNNALQGVVWFKDKFVAVGNADGTDALINTSEDGVLWTERANPKNIRLNAIAASSSLLVAVGDNDGATDAYIVTSSDGVTWTERANPKNFVLQGVTWSAALSLFIAVGNADGTDAYIITSPDGTTWTERANPQNVRLEAVAANSSLVVAVGIQTGAVKAYIVTSPDGITWTQRTTTPSSGSWHAVCWFKDKFIAAGDIDATYAQIYTSPNGITWTLRSNPQRKQLNALAASPNLVLAAGGDTGPYLISSRDGINWTNRENLSATSFLLAGAWSDVFKRFVMVGDSSGGTDTIIITSLAGR